MTFKSVNKNGKWYLHEFTDNDIGTWYDSSRGIYLIPDIILDAIASGYSSYYDHTVSLFDDHPEVFSEEYQDIRDILLLDDWIYEEMDKIESWLNDHDRFIIPENCYIGFNESYGDFGLWEIQEDDL